MPRIGELQFNWDAPCLVTEYEKLIVSRDMSFITSKEKEHKIMASCIYGWIGQKDRDDLAGLTWRGSSKDLW